MKFIRIVYYVLMYADDGDDSYLSQKVFIGLSR